MAIIVVDDKKNIPEICCFYIKNVKIVFVALFLQLKKMRYIKRVQMPTWNNS